MSRLMKGVAGIRGIVGDGLSPEVVARYGAAFGTWLKGGTVVVGSDARPSRQMVRSALISGLTAAGCDVIDLDLATTPTVAIMVEELKASGGVCVTASHNPIGWNALKFLDRKGHFLNLEDGTTINRIFETGEIEYVSTSQLGTVKSYDGAGEIHIQHVLDYKYLDTSSIRREQFRVAVDGINSVGNLVLPSILQELGCDVVKINSDVSGKFAREAEPLPENIEDLCELVKNEGADIGFALDPDGDRLAIVDEQGIPIGEEYSVALAAKYVLEHNPGPVVVNLSTTRAVEDIAKTAGVSFYRTPVGEAHVATEMDRTNAVVGGEGNGGVMLPAVHTGRDALVGATLVLSLMAQQREPLSVIVSRLPRYEMIKRKSPAEGLDAEKLLDALKTCFGNDASYDNRDGVRVDLPDGWVHVRLSNTEPIMRIFAEAQNAELANQLAQKAIDTLRI